jgi:crotonobetainyl-CoA:carnitine CoA-transferase CaiB-like acyl-CoA transferase
LSLLSITAFGRTGPLAKEPGYDLVVQGYGGVMSVTGPKDGAPHRVGLPIVDLSAGIYAATAALAALRVAERDGVGQRVDVSLFACHLAWLANVGSNALVSGEATPRYGNAHANVAPYEPFEAADGWLLLAVGNDRQWARLLALEPFAALDQPRWATNDQRVRDRDALAAALAPVLRRRTRQGWLDELTAARVPCGPILRPDEALAHPQAQALGMVHTVQHPSVGPLSLVGSPLNLQATPVVPATPPPRLGEGGDAVLREVLGMDEAGLAELRAAQAIR